MSRLRPKPTRKFHAYPHGWGEGKVHRYILSYENEVWYVACRGPYNDPHGRVTDDDAEVTCGKCKRGETTS